VQTCWAGATLILLLEMMYCKELENVLTSCFAFYGRKITEWQSCGNVLWFFSLMVVTVISLEKDMRNICINWDPYLRAVQGRIQNLLDQILMKCTFTVVVGRWCPLHHVPFKSRDRSRVFATAGSTTGTDIPELCVGQLMIVPEFQGHPVDDILLALSPHLAIYFLVYLSVLLFPNSYIILFWEFYFLPFSVHAQTNVIYLTLLSLL
jgi:hypothetical protein